MPCVRAHEPEQRVRASKIGGCRHWRVPPPQEQAVVAYKESNSPLLSQKCPAAIIPQSVLVEEDAQARSADELRQHGDTSVKRFGQSAHHHQEHRSAGDGLRMCPCAKIELGEPWPCCNSDMWDSDRVQRKGM